MHPDFKAMHFHENSSLFHLNLAFEILGIDDSPDSSGSV